MKSFTMKSFTMKSFKKKKIFILLFSLIITIAIITITISSCTATKDPNVLKVSSSSDKLVGENYQTVTSELKTTGFTNIKTVVLNDLITGWITKDGEVKQIDINGKTKFDSDTSFPKDSKIVITYHTFPKKEKSVAKPVDKPVDKPIDKPIVVPPVESTQAETEKKVTEKLVEEDYSVINKLIYEDLLQAKGWALGTLDRDGNPTKNGTPSPSFTFSLYIENITFSGDKLGISVFPKFEQLSDEDKTNISNTVQNMANVHANSIPYSTIRLNGDVIGHSKITNSKAFTWD